MSQIPLIRDLAPTIPKPETVPKSKNKSNSNQKQAASKASSRNRIGSKPHQEAESQPEAALATAQKLCECCRICGFPIAIPGLDASLCSNPAKTCGSNGWVVDPVWLATNPHRNKGGMA